ncbi:hypothetical protein GCM10007897_32020 [Sphingobium jiangsuense]|uniref:DUF3168 domain-containing protein n=1 Tax=Sphingobium jiangsuense TaxID=870476 RepID=A0A7W6BUY4_9SPHN|nr:DUF3168 domain-containing protein [Sphingobium jiangsuense]MBB3928314.1 hypothetical protein [Sphingobium jiangsuense]GLT01804.1 hypothetical protein GCM10007897_32020 [Sphingobium jiangsuense]
MDFQAGLLARLLADPAVSGIAGTRVHWLDRPQAEALPAISLQVISDPRPQHLKGFDGARDTTVQVDCWAASYGEALALARASIAALAPPATISGKRFGGTQVIGQRDLGETVGGVGSRSGGTFIHRQSVDFLVRHIGD